MAWALSRGGRRGSHRPLAGAAESSASDDARGGSALPWGAAGASDLGTSEGAGLAGTARYRDRLAGSEHDRRAVRPRGIDRETSAASAQAAPERAPCPLWHPPRRVVPRPP